VLEGKGLGFGVMIITELFVL
jgi:hypothetical protein